MAKSTGSEAATWMGVIFGGFVFVVYLLPRLAAMMQSGQQRSATGGLIPSSGSVYGAYGNPYAMQQAQQQNSLMAALASLLKGQQSSGGGKSGGSGMSGGSGSGSSSGSSSSLSNLFGDPNAINLGFPTYMPETYDQQTQQYADTPAPYSPSDGGPVIGGPGLSDLNGISNLPGAMPVLADDSSAQYYGGGGGGGGDPEAPTMDDN